MKSSIHTDLFSIILLLFAFLLLCRVYVLPFFDLDKIILRLDKLFSNNETDEVFPTPSSTGIVFVRSISYLFFLAVSIWILDKINDLIAIHYSDFAFTSKFSIGFLESVLQSMAGITAITVSALLLLTQLISEKYSTVIIHLFRRTTTSYTLLKIQIASIAFLATAIALSTEIADSKTQAPFVLTYLSMFLSAASILTLPPFLISIVQQFRPRGLVDWAGRLAEEQIKYLPSGGNRTWLRWHTLALVESLNSLKAIGASSVRENDDEITRRVILKYLSILKTYFDLISEDRSFREKWDPKMSEQLLYHFEGETDMVLSVSIEDARFWLENNILNSVSYMVEEANSNKGEVLFIIKNFYDEWSSLCRRKQLEVGLDVTVIIKMTLIDFYFIYRRLDLTKNEHLASENQHFFIKALHQIMFSYFRRESSEQEKDLENTLKVVTGFLKSIGLITSNANSEKLMQNWLLLIELTYERLLTSLGKDSEVLKFVGPSFARVYIDLFVESLLTRNHKLSKIILQHVVFIKEINLFNDFHSQTNKRLDNIIARSLSAENSIDASLVREDKYTYNLIKSFLLIMVYRLYMQEENLTEAKISSQDVIEYLKKFNQKEKIREFYYPHLKTELVSFIIHKLRVNDKHLERINSIVETVLV